MAPKQSASKSARPVVASPTSKAPASKAQASKPVKPAPAVTRPPAENGTAENGTAENSAAPRKQTPSQQAVAVVPRTRVHRALGAVASAFSWLRAPRSAVASASRAVVNWCGGGLPFATILFSVLGLADATYLTILHFTQGTILGCPENSTFNCQAVTTSNWSRLPAGPSGGIPVSVAGLAFFVFMVAVNSRWGWRARWAAVHWARLASVVVGIMLVLYLVWAELFRIKAICLYCTGVHIITFILFALIISRVVISGVQGTGTTDNG